MFRVVGYDGTYLKVQDTSDATVENYTPVQLRQIILSSGITINGVALAEANENPIYNIGGLHVTLTYQHVKTFGRWIVVLANPGDRFGLQLAKIFDKPTVLFYDSYNLKSNYRIYGQFVSSYYAETILQTTDTYGLSLDTSVPEWTVDAVTLHSIRDWVKGMI